MNSVTSFLRFQFLLLMKFNNKQYQKRWILQNRISTWVDFTEPNIKKGGFYRIEYQKRWILQNRIAKKVDFTESNSIKHCIMAFLFKVISRHSGTCVRGFFGTVQPQLNLLRKTLI